MRNEKATVFRLVVRQGDFGTHRGRSPAIWITNMDEGEIGAVLAKTGDAPTAELTKFEALTGQDYGSGTHGYYVGEERSIVFVRANATNETMLLACIGTAKLSAPERAAIEWVIGGGFRNKAHREIADKLDFDELRAQVRDPQDPQTVRAAEEMHHVAALVAADEAGLVDWSVAWEKPAGDASSKLYTFRVLVPSHAPPKG